jgi:hypothetical protein
MLARATSVLVAAWIVGSGHADLEIRETNRLVHCHWDRLGHDCVRALARDGVLRVMGVPGLVSARKAAFDGLARCVHPHAHALPHVLPDGTRRFTIAARTVNGEAEQTEPKGCDVQGDELRQAVREATQRLVALLDASAPSGRGHEGGPMGVGTAAMGSTNFSAPYHSLTRLYDAGEQLEHFHAYQLRSARQASTSGSVLPARDGPSARLVARAPTSAQGSTIPLHVDDGLLLTLVPPSIRELPEEGRRTAGQGADAVGRDLNPTGSSLGLFVRMADGSLVSAAADPVDPGADTAAEDASSLLFVVGQGWRTWLSPLLATRLRPAPHSVELAAVAAAAAEVAAEAGGR